MGDVDVAGNGAGANYLPYFNILNTNEGHFAFSGAGWELVSPDGTFFVELTYRADTLNPPSTPYGGNTMAPYLRVKPSGGTYQFLYPFSTTVTNRYSVYCSDKQLIIWNTGLQGPAGRMTNIFISSLAITDTGYVDAFIGNALLVIGSTISYDGSFFLGDDNTNTSQVRNQLWYVRGTAQNVNAFSGTAGYSQSQPGPGPIIFENGEVGFIMRGLDNGRDLLAANGQPLAQTPWLVVPEVHGAAPSLIIGKPWDMMLLSAGMANTTEGEIKLDGRRWRLLSGQHLGGPNLNGSLWITASTGEI